MNKFMTEKVDKSYQCPICKKQHTIALPKDLAKNREKFPFAHVIMHKFDGSTNIDDAGIDILTTLYIDANLAIRGVEGVRLTSSDVISKDDSSEIVTKLTNYILQLQEENNELERKYNALLKKK